MKSLRGAAMVLKSHEMPIKSREAKKTPKLCESCRNRPAFYAFNLCFKHLNALWSHNIAKKNNSIGAKGALLKDSKQACLT
jgi:TPP-dependent indolepyruvate ferredoxin oxidoreductase alpha subunit